jgi:hypothetical protein
MAFLLGKHEEPRGTQGARPRLRRLTSTCGVYTPPRNRVERDRVDEDERRIGLNEALFREVNERVRTINEGFSQVLEDAEFVCECGNQGCAERITLTLDDYERVRSDPTWFIVKPGHDAESVEEVIERHDGWWLVKKTKGEAADLAEELDPRS